MAEKEQLENTSEEDKKAAKKEKRRKAKEEKKKKKKDKEAGAEEEGEEEKLGSKIALVFVTLLIIIIWLAIIAILIKADVGGFGSTVLRPILKDVPYLNRILPEDPSDGLVPEDTQYQYDSLEDAVEQIKALELLLDEANADKEKNEQTIESLQEQIAELSKYREEQAEFEELQQKFYREVVFSEEAPDIEEYKAFYESIDKANAEALYKQVVEQITYNERAEEYAKTYSSMKPSEAAAIFNTMTNDLNLVADILLNMDTQSRADILGKMDVETAAKLTAIMEPEE